MKRKILISGLTAAILLLACLIHFQLNKDDYTVSALGEGAFTRATPHYDDGKGNIVRSEANGDLPTYITFNPGTEHYSAYGNRKLWEQYHMGCYLWYTLTEPIPHKQTTAQSIDYAQLIENRAARANLDYEWLVKRQKGLYQNLKLGSHEPNKHGRESFNGVETGTTVVVNPPEYKGKRYEWRYLGYATNGVPIENPFFPPDYPSASDASFDPKKKDWWTQPWVDGYGHPKKLDQSEYDAPQMFQQKVEWFVKYLFPELPQFRRADKYPNIYDDAADWANKFSLRTNPEKSTGVIVGFHGSGYYAAFSLKPPKLANMRLIEMKVFDKATGKLIGHFINDKNGSSCDLGAFDDKRWVINNSEVSVGDTLVVQATIKNMVIEGKEATTKHTPLRLYQMVSIDEDSVVFPNDWTIEPVDNVIPSINLDPEKRKNNLKPGETITFDMVKDDQTGQVAQWEFTVTPDIKKEFVLAAEIHDQHFLRGDNHYTGDDFGRLRFKIEQQDIATSDDMAELLDENGNVVTNVSPHKPHGLRIYLTRPKGKTPVGDPNNPTANPFAMVEVEVTDGVNTYVLEGQAKEVLKKGGKVAIDIPNAITPLTSKITAKWKVHWKHQATRQNEIFNNDTGTKTWATPINISVRNFDIQPATVYSPSSSSTQVLTFSFIVNNYDPSGEAKDIDIVIRKSNGQIVKKEAVFIEANKDQLVSWTLPVSDIQGDSDGVENGFVVEVNPPPRKWPEMGPPGVDIFADNVATNSVRAIVTAPITACPIVNTQNTWTTTYNIREWHGYLNSYTYCTEYGCFTSRYCVTTQSRSWTETVNHYERYQIKKVLFRSKLTRDTLGGDGWVDLLTNPNMGKVKAGYGFEIKFVVQFETNAYSAAPKGWPNPPRCSGKTVSPSPGYADAPTTLYVKMPFKDQNGQNVQYQLNATSVTGSWDNEVQTYEMPLRNAFNMKMTREIFVNETARDGTYQIEINTQPHFYGVSGAGKPSLPMLCDRKVVNVTILGANSDDIKSHITQ